MGQYRGSKDGGSVKKQEIVLPSPSPSPSMSLLSSSSSDISSNANVLDIGAESWAKAEKVTENILQKVQPTAESDHRRRAVTDYIQRLFRNFLGCEVFPYGSVPLKTYLPDGDIDLTTFGGTNFEDALANDMVSILEAEDQNKAAEFIVKDVQLIRAEVKLVKCIVQNIVVDISLNQIGGLCTLCFLEQVDRLIGKDHLFKRSIILIKTWCYYESRILGAHHGLISTYALETLVLYIFHFFHATLDGPLAVLYKFLDYFSKFDWENYCVSLTGPVRISSLPESVAEMPVSNGGDLLLSNDFVRYCLEMFSVPPKAGDSNSRTFLHKYLNIIDPLKETNNLGRSVSKGNFYRIRSAFNYGATKLESILLQSEDSIAEELYKFFPNTMDRHDSGERPDVQDPSSSFCLASPAPNIEPSQIEQGKSELCFASDGGTHRISKLNPDGSSCREDRHQKGNTEAHQSVLPLKAESHGNGSSVGYRLLGDAADLASSIENGLSISTDMPDLTDSSSKKCQSSQGMPCYAPHLFFANSLLCNGEMKNEISHMKQFGNSEKSVSSSGSSPPTSNEGKNFTVHGLEQTVLDVKEAVSSIPKPYSCSGGDHLNWDLASTDGSRIPLKALSDLSGDYDNYFNSLQYGLRCYEYALIVPALPVPPAPPSPYHIKYSWEAAQLPSYMERNGFSHGSTNGVIPSQAFCTINPMLMHGMPYALEEMPKQRGTGTYFPNLDRPPQGYRPSVVKGRHQAGLRSPRTNGRATFTEMHTLERSFHEQPQSESSADQSNVHPLLSPHGRGHRSMTGLVLQAEGVVEFGSVGLVPLGTSISQKSRQNAVSSPTQQSSPVSPIPAMQRSNSVFSKDLDRVTFKSSYHLKDDDDFPPLSF
ncbi:hypothetical protein T459_23431 [Capsicum annuum]|uniref:Polymerase nucleotidyl transferase domain-containing protein n=1 Tax=Capsicum annuum TaxID=4072 RepID=A0A1U8EE22_CAPAN|nr:uncharacterized protein LOC107842678 isoform X1 [Capsicum annuum]PHT72646.1 hypothetical protein T459_23431 [Capsicum annuum]